MKTMKKEYIEKIYSGWLAKVIGVRLGAAIEGWSYQRIKDVFGELDHYPMEYKQFAADDDTNGPLFFLRALEDSKNGIDITAQDVGEALLNYACFEKGFFWWGGYGTSTEHTAYLNLRAGIKAPQSGSIAQNGSAVAEQIGGQIFIDTWGLVTPGNPDLAAHYARLAASVTHDGNGIYGGMFIAACISYAFEERNITKIIEKGLSYIPSDCEYTRVVRAVMGYHEEHPENWRDCFRYIFDNYGYDKYPGNCHIIPNSAVMVLALLYGNGNFSDTINICNMCGWDTDCNVGNIATIMGVVCGLDAIDYHKWREPINDILICSSVVGSLNIMDIPYGASYIAKLAAQIAGEELPEPWNTVIGQKLDNCHFEYPGSTHGIRARSDSGQPVKAFLRNTDEAAYTGERSLRASVTARNVGRVLLYKKTYYVPRDFSDSRYDPSFSPVCYPGQTITGSLKLVDGSQNCQARAYVHNAATDEIITVGDGVILTAEEWSTVSLEIPHLEAGLIDEAGFALDFLADQGRMAGVDVYLDDFEITGIPDYTIDFTKVGIDRWGIRKEISQFTKLKGLTYLDGGRMHVTCADFGETYTGGYDWKDYTATFHLKPECGSCHLANVRVQGAIRSYAAGFGADGKVGFYKNDNGYTCLAEVDFKWQKDQEYVVQITAKENHFVVSVDGMELLQVSDVEHPYLQGGIGLSVQNGSHVSVSGIEVHS